MLILLQGKKKQTLRWDEFVDDGYRSIVVSGMRERE
jgi:hypothetical protein